MNLLKEVAKDPFDPDDFVERLAKHAVQVQDPSSKGYDIGLLHDTFTTIISELGSLLKEQRKRCEKLEIAYKEEEARDLQKVTQLQQRNKSTVMMFHELDERINYVAAKVIHLGDQLESVDAPRAKVFEAQNLMNYFDDLYNPGSFLMDDIFTDSSRIVEAAQLILKLNSIALELPDEKFSDVKKRITSKYIEVERSLIEEFHMAHQRNEIAAMKELAYTMVQFKGYSQCVDAFIEHSQTDIFSGADLFEEAIPMCERNYKLVKLIFPNPGQVMGKFVLNLFSLKLQDSARMKLRDRSDLGKYLDTLHNLYTKTVETVEAISKFDMGNDETYMEKLTGSLFRPYLDDYIKTEVENLKGKCHKAMDQYYDSKNHQKRQQNDGNRFHDLRRDLQAVIGARANINIGQTDDFGGETFISEELAAALLQESETCFKRCAVLSKPGETAGNALKLVETILQSLLVSHVDYALELAMQTLPVAEGKTFPQLHFFEVVRRTNSVSALFEQLLVDSVVPLVRGTPKYSDCIAKERSVFETIENKLDSGLDRILNAIVGWVKVALQTEQRRPDGKSGGGVCQLVVQNIRQACKKIRTCLDKKNSEVVMTELGVRFHRVILDHLFQNQFNTSEAYNIYIEVTEYKRCAEEMNIPLVTTLFETLQALWKILIVPPENLKEVCSDSQLADIDESVLSNFMQLRRDSKKANTFLKGV